MKFPAVIRWIKPYNKAINLYGLNIDNSRFKFYPGQWVDCFVNGSDDVTGFTICSTPKEYKATNVIELAIKRSNHPITRFMFENAKIGSQVYVQPGGKCIIDDFDKWKSYKFICGGIGINPAWSIIKSMLEENIDKPIFLYYVVRCLNDAIFLDNISLLCDKYKTFAYKLFLTNSSALNDSHTLYRKPNISDILTPTDPLKYSTLYYLCGPIPMMQYFIAELNKESIPNTNILYEKWE